jgi:hypothetical protein
VCAGGQDLLKFPQRRQPEPSEHHGVAPSRRTAKIEYVFEARLDGRPADSGRDRCDLGFVRVAHRQANRPHRPPSRGDSNPTRDRRTTICTAEIGKAPVSRLPSIRQQEASAPQETPLGVVNTASLGQGGREAALYAFDTQTEKVEDRGPAAVGKQTYIATIDADPTGRFLYYVAGAHGGSPVVQFDTKTRTRKVIAFVHPFYQQKYGCTPKGTYSAAMDPAGDKLYVTWNVSRGSRTWDCCALTVVHIPESERKP